MIKNIINIYRSYYEDSSKIVNDTSLCLKDGKPTLSLLERVGSKIINLICLSKGKATSRIRLLHKFHTYLMVMSRRHGKEYTVKYLKLSALIITKFLAKQPVRSYRELEPDLFFPRVKRGLPAIIGTRDISALYTMSYTTIRL